MNLQLLQEVFELNQAFERIIEGLKRMEKVRFSEVAMVRETRVEVLLAQIDFNRQFFDEFHKDYEKDERWACEFKRECEDKREDPEDAYLEIKDREEARQKKGLPPRVTFLPDWDGGDERRRNEQQRELRKQAAKKRRKGTRRRTPKAPKLAATQAIRDDTLASGTENQP